MRCARQSNLLPAKLGKAKGAHDREGDGYGRGINLNGGNMVKIDRLGRTEINITNVSRILELSEIKPTDGGFEVRNSAEIQRLQENKKVISQQELRMIYAKRQMAELASMRNCGMPNGPGIYQYYELTLGGKWESAVGSALNKLFGGW